MDAKKCNVCDGNGGHVLFNLNEPCGACGGSGTEPLVSKKWTPRPQDLADGVSVCDALGCLPQPGTYSREGRVSCARCGKYIPGEIRDKAYHNWLRAVSVLCESGVHHLVSDKDAQAEVAKYGRWMCSVCGKWIKTTSHTERGRHERMGQAESVAGSETRH